MCGMTPSHVWHDSSNMTWLLHLCDMTPWYVWRLIQICGMTPSHVPPRRRCLLCVTWVFHVCDVTPPCLWHDSSVCVTWILRMCNMTFSYVPHDPYMCVRWLLLMCDKTPSIMCSTWPLHMSYQISYGISKHYICHTGWLRPSYVISDIIKRALHMSHQIRALYTTNKKSPSYVISDICDMTPSDMYGDSFICVTWLLHMCHPVESAYYVWHDSFIYVTRLPDMFLCVTWLHHICHKTPWYVPPGTYPVDGICRVPHYRALL